MTFELIFSDRAKEDIADLKKSEKNAHKKLEKLLIELIHHPTTGTGKPEQLRYELSDLWSRRIDRKNRLVYRIEEEKVFVEVVSAKGHY